MAAGNGKLVSGGGERRAWFAWITMQVRLIGEQCGGGNKGTSDGSLPPAQCGCSSSAVHGLSAVVVAGAGHR
jgi:hypothetical protein